MKKILKQLFTLRSSLFPLRSSLFASRSGQSIAELLIASGIFALAIGIILGLVLDSYRATTGGEEDTIAMFLAQEGLGAARSVRDNAWLNLTTGAHGVTSISGFWEFSGSSDVAGKFTRAIAIEEANRLTNDSDIVASGGQFWGRTKKVTSTVTWTTDDVDRSVSAVAYLTDWNVFDWLKTKRIDFLAGTYLNSTSTLLDISSNSDISVDDVVLSASAAWNNVGGSNFFHASSTDFSPGTFSSTTISGSGLPADIQLLQDTIWTNASSTERAPISNQLNDVSMISISDGWMVGNGGSVLQWNGLKWNSTTTAAGTNNLNAIDMLSADLGWIVGNDQPGAPNAIIMKWDGENWITQTSPVSFNLYAIDMISATDGWAVGDSGKILHWDGASWGEFVDTGSQKWNDVFLVSATDGWAVGSGGAVFRWDGSSWSSVTSPAGQPLNAIDMISATDGWAVGDSGKILHWDGASWSEFVDTGNEKWNDIKMISAVDGWAVADSGIIFRWNGASWGSASSPSGSNLQGLDMVSEDEGWGVGSGGTIIHYAQGSFYTSGGSFLSPVLDSGIVGSTWDFIFWSETLPSVFTDLTVAVRTGPTDTPDGSWSNFSAEFSNPIGQTIGRPNNRYAQYRVTMSTSESGETPLLHDITIIYNAPTSQNLNGVYILSLTDGWAVGDSGKILHWDGASWSSFTSPTITNLNAIDMVSATDGWAVGNDVSGPDNSIIIYWNGSGWSIVSAPSAVNLYAIDMVSATDGWAVGDSGKILHWDGASWSEFVDTGNESWKDISLVSSIDGWVVGSGGSIRRWNGISWDAVASPIGNSIESVDMVSATDGWAGASAGQILRWDGASWSQFVDTGAESWNDVDMVSASDGWIVGSGGAVRQWKNSAWNSFTSPVSNNLNSVFMLDEKNGWAVANSGTIIKYTKQFFSGGTFTSDVLDTGTSTNRFFQNIFWTETLPSDTDITIATRSGETIIPDITWSAFSDGATVATGSPILSPNRRYLQWRATLTTADVATTSQLRDVTVTYK